ncbi:cyclic 2,3-diphosphoglycerate synthase [Natranaerobius thermophilus JW/NM-WN-LF]|uniref:GTPase-like protein n=2 Tax=Natranaerobius TaxID=375928 RepID=B2A4R1_NATTJ|nr:cyclic 2,3-diphosphoglycerate synthase [Natranaerobius thermophilus]ACB83833.1 GTPase-like protein [Natranaerobius thermophilus JW/NM-WN-LF]
MTKKVLIMGAAGRDFHNYNVYFRDNDDYEVVAMTATQIPNIEGRKYPPELAGDKYPNGIDIYAEEELTNLISKHNIDEVVFSYSDVPHEYVMNKASEVNSAGADFKLMGPNTTMLESEKPVISICAVRTGIGKSQTTRRVCDLLREKGKQVVVIRHPMPYGDLAKQTCQRFADYDDLDKHECTIEEREEYEPHIDRGIIVYAGVDYEKILKEAEKEADVIIWDGGNNDIPFYKPDLHMVLVDPHRPGHELKYYPGESNLRMADVAIVNKIDSASNEGVQEVRHNIEKLAPNATVVEGVSPVFPSDIDQIKDKRVLVVEDGPTLTHGEMTYGAGTLAAQKFGAKEIVDPRPFAVGSIKETFETYTHLGNLLPAMGYGREQMKELEDTINKTECDTVILGTPIDLRRVANIERPAVRIRYELQEMGIPTLEDILKDF